MSAFSAALSLAITPALKDPNLHWVFLAIGLAGFLCAIVMLAQFWNLDKWMENETNEKKDWIEKKRKPTEESTMLIIQLKQLYLSSHDYIFIYKITLLFRINDICKHTSYL